MNEALGSREIIYRKMSTQNLLFTSLMCNLRLNYKFLIYVIFPLAKLRVP